MLDPEGADLRDRLLRVFRRGAEAPLDEGAFDDLARRVLAYQLDHLPAYAGYCRARGIDSGDLPHWAAIPAVPTSAFKEIRLLAAGATAEAVFRTSGTTRGPERRGEHHVADLELYRGSLRPTFRRALLADGAQLRFLSLVPPPDLAPDSSLSFMVDDVLHAFGAEGSRTVAELDAVDFDALDAAVESAAEGDVPVLLLGTTAAFIHWLDRLAAVGRRHGLPGGSRLMDTGGFKGGGRSVEPDALRREYGARLGLPAAACVNEYGMTEMLSQLYDASRTERNDAPPSGTGPDVGRREADVDRREADVDRPEAGGRDPAGAVSHRPKRGPPWVRSVAVDPDTLEPLAPGRPGILRHVDLANLGSVSAIQTEDYGRVLEDGSVVLEGRAAGAPPRGCSIAMDLLLSRS